MSGPTSATARNTGFEVREVGDQVGADVVDNSRGSVAERPELVERLDEPGALAQQNVQRGRDVAKRSGDDVLLARHRRGESIQFGDSGDDVVPLIIQRPDKGVEPAQQISDITLSSGEHPVEGVDDLADLTEAACVDHRRQRRKCLFGGRVHR